MMSNSISYSLWRPSIILLELLFLQLDVISAKVVLPAWFGDHMVLQTNDEYGARSFLNGMADPDEKVNIILQSSRIGGVHNMEEFVYTTVADSITGKWTMQLDPASILPSQASITVTGNHPSSSSNVIVAHNVTFGDVFFCSGQSNMVFPMDLILNSTAELDTLKGFPNMRFFVTTQNSAFSPQWDLPEQGHCMMPNGACNRWITHWEAMDNDNTFLKKFSAVCYLTARNLALLHVGTKRSMALIQTAVGGTRVEAWMSPESIAQSPYVHDIPRAFDAHNQPSVLYNAMIHPWTHFAVRSVLWYQGEANAQQTLDDVVDPVDYYATMYQDMIADFRLRKGMGDFAWGTIQLPPSVSSGDTNNCTGRMFIRMAQQDTIPHIDGKTDISAVAVTLDLGGKSTLGYNHPPNKSEVSRRLALGVLHAAYALQDLNWTGPIPGEATIRHNNEIVLSFEYASGMKLRDVKCVNIDGSSNNCQKCCTGAPPFEVQTGEGRWIRVPLDSIDIKENLVKLDISSISGGVFAAMNVRYAWTDYVDCVLVNSDGLVTSPFVHRVKESRTKSTRRQRNREYFAGTNKLSPAVRSSLRGVNIFQIQSPPMGFNSWNFYHCNIDENLIKAIADAMADKTGMKEIGYKYINIDDCWQVVRFQNGTIQADPSRFPSGMKALADYVHSRGLRLGLYTAQGSRTCQNRPGSYDYEEIDAQTFCDWGIDYLKVDSCGGTTWPVLNTSWIKFRKEIDSCARQTQRQMVLSVEYCRAGNECEDWITRTANLWRTSDDVQASWSSVLSNIHAQESMYEIAGPGHFNDPDMLQIGNVGLSIDEQYSHMSLWCISGAPLLIGSDLIHPTNTTLDILTNPEVIAVNQDLGWKNKYLQGRVILRIEGHSEVWAKHLSNGRWAVLLLNLQDDEDATVALTWRDLGLDSSTVLSVRDLWMRRDIGHFANGFKTVGLAPHACLFLRVTPTKTSSGWDAKTYGLRKGSDGKGLGLSK